MVGTGCAVRGRALPASQDPGLPLQKGSADEPAPPRPRREIGEPLRQGGQVGDRTVGAFPFGGELALQRRDVCA